MQPVDLLKSIAHISKLQPFEAYEIWLKLLEGATPDYPEESVRDILNNLVLKGPEGIRKAKEIISIYLKFGNERPLNWFHEIIEES